MRRWQERLRVPARASAGVLLGALMFGAFTTLPTAPAGAYPGQDEIAAARAAADDAAASVAQLDAAIAQLEDALHQADVAARLADEDYHLAHEAAVSAQRQLFAANNRAEEAEAALASARSSLAAVAMADYRNAGSLGSVEAIVKADGYDDVVTRTEALARASAEADATVQEVRAAEIVAETTRKYAEEAAVRAEEAEQKAADALKAAQDARAAAEQAVTEAAEAQAAALSRLAELRGVTAELEAERQAGLAAERRAREQAAFEEEQKRIEEAAAAEREREEQNSGGTNVSNPVTPSPRPSETSTPQPEPTDTSTPEPEPTDTSTPEPEPTEASTPEPEPTETSTPEPEPKPSNSWKSTSSQGVKAANHSLTLIGSPYAYGGNGPAYDCSGLTSASWRAAGHYIPRSSRTQYAGVTLLPYSQLRKGDLVFWGSGKNASAIYHVAIYVGNGQVMEARTYGKTAATRSMYNWAVSDMMPYIGRP